MKGKGLGEARGLFRARRFPDVIRLLEPEVFRYRENVEYFELLGFSCLHTGDLGGAFSYISRAHQLKDDDLTVVLGLAAIHLRKGENEQALKRWLSVLEAQPGNPVAKRGLELLRRGLTPDRLQELIDSGKIRQYYPPLPGKGAGRGLIVALVVVLGLVVVAGLGYTGYHFATRPTGAARPGVTSIEIPAGPAPVVDAGASAVFQLSEKEVRQTFQKAKSYLLAYRDNLAAVEINRLLMSNATPAIKERARMLKGFVTQASFDTLKDAFTYAAVAAQPALYDGCSVRWKGKIANYRTGREAITFDLLVGYDQEKELEGIVPVTLTFAADLTNGQALEVLGQVVLKNGALTLLGVSLHKLAL